MPLFGSLTPEKSSIMTEMMEEDRRYREGMKPWLQGRLALSKQTSRFELPMDVTLLEHMTPLEYITKHCIISKRRKNLYKITFIKIDRDRDGKISLKELEKGLKEIHVNSVSQQEINKVVEMVEVEPNRKFDLNQFQAIAALSERVFYSSFLPEQESESIHYKKEVIEEADFCNLNWKLSGCKVSDQLRRILDVL